tara:strand:+ start:659 stop:1060 length:402 start_codon:yes stop_codon:yes gene_type:complete
MDISLAMKNQILFDNVDLLQLSKNKLKQWLMSNFVNILCDHKIYIETVSITPHENIDTNLLYTIKASNEKENFVMEFGELKTSDILNLKQNEFQQLFIVNMSNDYDQLSVLKKLNGIRYNLSVISNTKTLLLF